MTDTLRSRGAPRATTTITSISPARRSAASGVLRGASSHSSELAQMAQMGRAQLDARLDAIIRTVTLFAAQVEQNAAARGGA